MSMYYYLSKILKKIFSIKIIRAKINLLYFYYNRARYKSKNKKKLKLQNEIV